MTMLEILKEAWKHNRCGTKNMRFKQIVLSKYQDYRGWCRYVEVAPLSRKEWLLRHGA